MRHPRLPVDPDHLVFRAGRLGVDARSTTGGMPGQGLGLANAANGAAVALGAVGTARTMRQGLPKEINETTQKIDEEVGKYFGEQKWSYGDPAKS